jgi:hypothetical protein
MGSKHLDERGERERESMVEIPTTDQLEDENWGDYYELLAQKNYELMIKDTRENEKKYELGRL